MSSKLEQMEEKDPFLSRLAPLKVDIYHSGSQDIDVVLKGTGLQKLVKSEMTQSDGSPKGDEA